jgi:hypothetical protein
VPIQLDILCYSWDEIKQKQQRIGSFTITTLYQAMIYKLWRKDILYLELQDRGLVLTEKIVHGIRLPWRIELAVQPENFHSPWKAILRSSLSCTPTTMTLLGTNEATLSCI